MLFFRYLGRFGEEGLAIQGNVAFAVEYDDVRIFGFPIPFLDEVVDEA